MIGVYIAIGALVVVAVAVLVLRGRRAAHGPGTGPVDPAHADHPHHLDDHVQGFAARSAEADTVVPQPAPPTPPRSSRARQCPRCGRHTVSAAHGDVSCSWCALGWHQPADADWPDVNLCLWIPPSDRAAVKEKT